MATFSVVLSYVKDSSFSTAQEAKLRLASWDEVEYTTWAWFDFSYDKENILEELFRLFNFEFNDSDETVHADVMPMLRTMCVTWDVRSMSVGDIVSLEIGGRVQHHRCMSSGWEVVPEITNVSMPEPKPDSYI